MGWTLLGAGLLLALYTLLRHGLRRSPPLRDRNELRGRTAIVTGERRERTAPGREEGKEEGPGPALTVTRSVPSPQGEAAVSGRPRRWSWPAAGPASSWPPATPRGGRPPPAASAR